MDIGTLGGDHSTAYAVNDAGQVAGTADLAPGEPHAFLYNRDHIKDLSPGGHAGSVSRGINNEGAVIGYVYLEGSQWPKKAFVYRQNALHFLPGLDRKNLAIATGINRHGQIVGTANSGMFVAYAVLWTQYGKVMHKIGVLPGGRTSNAEAVNDQGHIVGASDIDRRGTRHGFFYADKRMHDLGTIGGSVSHANAINNTDQIVGESENAAGRMRAFLWDRGKMADLGTLADDGPGAQSTANGINDAGWVVGESSARWSGQTCAVLWRRGQPAQDLNRLVPPGSGWKLSRATAISPNGNIVGEGDYQGRKRAFLLVPT